jgi:hypothetical protein
MFKNDTEAAKVVEDKEFKITASECRKHVSDRSDSILLTLQKEIRRVMKYQFSVTVSFNHIITNVEKSNVTRILTSKGFNVTVYNNICDDNPKESSSTIQVQW